jgi:hypothetical protein
MAKEPTPEEVVMTRRMRWVLGTVVLALIAGGVPAEAAKRKKKVFKAHVNGQRWKSAKRYTGLTAGGGTIAFSAFGTKRAGIHGFTKILGVACANDLSLQTFPFTTTLCTTTYSEVRGRPLTQRTWYQNVGGTEVTVESYDGVRIVARFRTIMPLYGLDSGLPDVNIEGEWHGPVELGDGSR